MKQFSLLLATLVLFAAMSATQTYAQNDADQEIAVQGTAVAKKHCYRCHGEKFNGNAQFNVMDREGLLDDEYQYVVPGNLDESYMWQRVVDGDMPPEGEAPISAAEKEILRQWILAGAPSVERPERPYKYEEDILKDILADLLKTRTADRKYTRYFTLTHLYNNNHSVSAFDLQLYRAAFSKAINSLSWENTIVVPTPIDAEQTVFRIDLRDYGFDRPGDWQAVLKEYPYGLKFNHVANQDIVELDRQVELLSGTPLAYVRADWFTVTATRPPLYHYLLRIPETDFELEQQLKTDVIDDFLKNKLNRAGFAESGVSTANRLLDRHPSVYGYYWKSYDFAPSKRNGNLFRYPLGPAFEENPFNQQAFEQDGGEIIFSLPNQLQGYMLVDAKGKRIDEGPINVVRDLKETAGSPVVVNGISCMHCHQNGMIRFKDSVLEGLAVFGEPREKAHLLYPKQETMNRIVDKDARRFLEAIEEATGPFLQIGEDKNKPIETFAEPVGAIARFYFRDMTAEDAAFELGIDDPRDLQAAIKFNPLLKRLGLGPLANGSSIDRLEWENREFLTSPMQEAARILDRATPFVVVGGK